MNKSNCGCLLSTTRILLYQNTKLKNGKRQYINLDMINVHQPARTEQYSSIPARTEQYSSI